MKKLLARSFLLFLALLFLTFGSKAQNIGVRYDNFVFQNNPNNYVTIPNGAFINVCLSTASGNPCSPQTTVYQDSGLTTPLLQPIFPVNGNFGFWLTPNQTYQITINGAGVTPQVVFYYAPVNPANTASITWSGPMNFSTQNFSLFNVRGFGAKGDGVTNDTAAIQSAITAAENLSYGGYNIGGTVFFPCGNYLINAPLTYKGNGAFGNGLRFAGEDWSCAVLAINANLAGTWFFDNATPATVAAHISWSNLHLVAQGFTANGIHVNNVNFCSVDHIWFSNLNGFAGQTEPVGNNNCVWYDIRVENNFEPLSQGFNILSDWVHMKDVAISQTFLPAVVVGSNVIGPYNTEFQTLHCFHCRDYVFSVQKALEVRLYDTSDELDPSNAKTHEFGILLSNTINDPQTVSIFGWGAQPVGGLHASYVALNNQGASNNISFADIGGQAAQQFLTQPTVLGSKGNVAQKYLAADANLFVSSSGNDTNDGLSPGTAMLTLQAAYNALPSGGGSVSVGCGTFSFSSGLLFTTNSKPIKLRGSGPCTVLNYTGSSGTALDLDTGGGNPATSSVLEDFNLSTTVSGSTALGLLIGNVNTAKGSMINRVHITGFKTLAESNTFGTYWNSVELNTCSSASGSVAFLVGATQDDTHFIGGQLATCNTIVSMTTGAAGPLHMSSVDLFASSSGAVILSVANSNLLYCEYCHLVNQPAAGNPDFFSIATNGQISFVNSIMEDDTTSGSYASLAQNSSGFLYMTNSRFSGSGSTVTGESVLMSGTAMASFVNTINAGFSTNQPLWNTSFSGGSICNLAQLFPSGQPAQFCTPNGFGNGSSGTAMTTTTRGTGSGPGTPQTVVQYMEVTIAGTVYWVPLVQ